MAKKGKQQKLTYKDAGVDIDAGNELASRYVALMESTFTKHVVRNDGGFGGLFGLKGLAGIGRAGSDPVLVSGTDGVGTKLKIAFLMDRHDTVGIDLVAMSVNDVLVQGARPLFFLDYVATGQVEKRVQLEIVEGVAEGCRQSGCSLLGGETAELPGFYQDGEYDLAGFAVGIVERKRLLDGRAVREGDVILGIPSSGLHSNGYSLARKALLEAGGYKVNSHVAELGRTVGEELLTPTRIYVKPVMDAIESYARTRPVHALVHVTGGGLIENVPRILPKGCSAKIRKSAWPQLPVFNLIQSCGQVDEKEMYRVFNMGIGMVLIVAKNSAGSMMQRLAESGAEAFELGAVVKGSRSVKLVK